MEEIRAAALAYYGNASEEQKELTRNLFNCLDADGNGTVDSSEFFDIFTGQSSRDMKDNRIFQALDRDGNGSLDFNEFLTLYYIIKSRRPFCDWCRIFITGLFFTCVHCHESSENTFDLCSECYRHKHFRHEHATFLDNYALLEYKRELDQSSTSPTQTQTWTTSASPELTLARGSSKREKVLKSLKMIEIGLEVGTTAATACSIM